MMMEALHAYSRFECLEPSGYMISWNAPVPCELAGRKRPFEFVTTN